MAFLIEVVSKEGMEYLKSFHFPTPPGCGNGEWIDKYFQLGSTDWIIDKERDIVLINLCGQGHRYERQYPPTYHYLIWQGKPIRIESYDTSTGDRTTGRNIVWKIDNIVAPDSLGVSVELLINTIKEAFETYERGRSKYISSIEFIEIAQPTFVKGDVKIY
jgi:hypothetical protein